jgi:peptide-methionine (S)-S-oxide reductase
MTSGRTETATLGGGCFWCIEAVFERLAGVEKVVSGYAGGATARPTYEQVCSGTTGHAEVIQVTFDPTVVSYRDLLEVFFAFHDPTTPDRQGADRGTQYRSVILYHSPEQKQTAEDVIRDLDARGYWDVPIVTQVVPLEAFHPAEDYHQGFYRLNPDQPYCRALIPPKLAKLKAKYRELLKDTESAASS